MLRSFQMAYSVVEPIVVYIVIGIIIVKIGFFTKDNFKEFNKLCFKFFIPLSLFFSLYNAKSLDLRSPGIFLYCILGTGAAFAFAWWLFKKTTDDIKDRATLTQAIFRSNVILFGMVIAKELCDDAGVAVMAVLLCIMSFCYNITSVVMFESIRGGKVSPIKLVADVLKVPMIDAALLGLVFTVFHLRLPAGIEKPLSSLSSAATPIALVTLGGILSAGSMKKHAKNLALITVVRLVFLPIVMLAIAVALGFRGYELVGVLAVFGTPAAVASTSVAQIMGGNGELAGEIVAVTSVVSVITMFLLIASLSGMGLI